MTEDTCIRRGGSDSRNLTLPLAWLMDDVKDCMNGDDETDVWPTCGAEMCTALFFGGGGLDAKIGRRWRSDRGLVT